MNDLSLGIALGVIIVLFSVSVDLDLAYMKNAGVDSRGVAVIDRIWHPEFIIKSEIARRESLFKTLHINPEER